MHRSILAALLLFVCLSAHAQLENDPAYGLSTDFRHPGYLVGGFGPYGVSSYLVDLANTSHYEGSYVYTIWCSADEVIGWGTIVYGTSTCRIPAQNGEKTFSGYPYGHIGAKDQTGYWQWRMVKFHSTS